MMFLVSMALTKNWNTNFQWPTQNKMLLAVYRIVVASVIWKPFVR